MSSTSTYLNFSHQTEEAFTFYKQVFQTEFDGEITRFGQIPPQPGQPPVSESDKDLLMHISLPITGGHLLHGTDAPESMGFTLTQGNNVYIMVEPDTREEADRLFTELSADGKVEMPMSDQFWGDYFGSLTDKFDTNWMINKSGK